MNDLSARTIEAAWGYLVFGGMASAAPLALVLGAISVSSSWLGVRRAAALAKQAIVFAVTLFAFGLPAGVAFELFMRERFYTDNDPIVDWLPWIPSGDWVVDVACQGHYLRGASAWSLRVAWAILAVPVWVLTLFVVRQVFGARSVERAAAAGGATQP